MRCPFAYCEGGLYHQNCVRRHCELHHSDQPVPEGFWRPEDKQSGTDLHFDEEDVEMPVDESEWAELEQDYPPSDGGEDQGP